MATAEVLVPAIKNRSKVTITIRHPRGGPVEVEPGGTLEGPFIYEYDPDREGAIPSPNEIWIIHSADEFQWGMLRVPT